MSTPSRGMHKLAVCCLNISEGRDIHLINRIAHAAVRHQPTSPTPPFKCDTTVLSVYSDPVFNRSNVTIASTVRNLARSVSDACAVAFEALDLTRHVGANHPRLGVVDLIPVHPLSASVSLEDCSEVAHHIGQLITNQRNEFNFDEESISIESKKQELSIAANASKTKQSTNTTSMQQQQNPSVFYFGKADHENRDLVARRKGMQWFDGSHGQPNPDLGTFSEKYGITAIGAIPYMSVLNVLLDTDDLEFGKNIASNIRQRNKTTGLEGVQAMAFLKGSKVEIACNIDTNDLQSQVSIKNIHKTYF